VWNEEYREAGVEWAEVLKLLHESAAPIKVIEVNSRSSGTLNYKDYANNGLHVIAVGGFSLSRGLTLEGLTVSYFLRNSMMYDTLMQMGRWFGYRPGYDDLCRVWMPEEAEGWYTHIAESIEMLRDELRSMEAASATPEEFGLKVRSHPDTLIVTARNKIGAGERVVVNIGLANSFVETAILKRSESSLKKNRHAVTQLAKNLEHAGLSLTRAGKVSSGWLINKASANNILHFISSFDNHHGSFLSDPKLVTRYIEDRAHGELAEWDILFTSLQKPETMIYEVLGIPIYCQKRSAGDKSDHETLRISNSQRVASRGVEQTGLSKEEIHEAQRKYSKSHVTKTKRINKVNYPDHIYRAERKRPLLIVHLLKIDSERGGREHQNPVVAWSISFPKTKVPEKRVEYVVNTTWLRENYRDDIDEDEIGGDNE